MDNYDYTIASLFERAKDDPGWEEDPQMRAAVVAEMLWVKAGI